MKNRGNISLPGILIILMISCFYIISLHNTTRTHRKMQIRSNAYLCFKYQIRALTKYIKNINRLNLGIRSAYLASFEPHLSASAKQIQQMLQQLQSLIHLSYLKKINTCKYCSKTDPLPFTINIPYQLQGPVQFSRALDGTTRIKKKKWTLYQNIHTQFILKANCHLKSKFTSQLALTSTEIPLTDFVNWRH